MMVGRPSLTGCQPTALVAAPLFTHQTYRAGREPRCVECGDRPARALTQRYSYFMSSRVTASGMPRFDFNVFCLKGVFAGS
jgi:hypothetical protein